MGLTEKQSEGPWRTRGEQGEVTKRVRGSRTPRDVAGPLVTTVIPTPNDTGWAGPLSWGEMRAQG